MTLSFIILSYNSARYIETCVLKIDYALRATGLSYEMLILDNGSTDGSQDLLRKLAAEREGRLHAHFEQRNTGTTRSRNRLFARASGDYLCVMDSDVELQPGVVEGLLAYLDGDESVGIVAPRIIYKSGAWQKSFDRFPTVTDKIERFFRLKAIERREGARFHSLTEPMTVDYAISAFWLMRRDTIARVGMLDERIFYSPEDVDFCLRVWKAGLKIVYVPSLTIVHDAQEISRGFRLTAAKLSHLEGLIYYFNKHDYWFRRPRFSHNMLATEKESTRSSFLE